MTFEDWCSFDRKRYLKRLSNGILTFYLGHI